MEEAILVCLTQLPVIDKSFLPRRATGQGVNRLQLYESRLRGAFFRCETELASWMTEIGDGSTILESTRINFV